MKKVLIFGIGGFVGSYLLREFESQGYEVFGCDVMKDNNSPNYHQVDLLDQDKVYNVIETVHPEIIVNLAAISSVGMSWGIPQTTMSVNVIGSLNILEAVRQLNCSTKILFVGSSEEYEISDDPIDENKLLNANNPYGISKVAQEQFASIYRDKYGLQVYCVRAFNHTGVGQKDTFVFPSFCKQVAEIERSGKEGKIYVGNLSAKRDFSNVKDIVRAYRLIVEQDDCETIYNVGYGKAYSIKEILEYIISLSTQKIKVIVDESRVRPVDNPMICCDNRLIKKELHWEPKYDIFETVKEMYEYYLKAD